MHLPVLRVADVLDGRIESTAQAGDSTGGPEQLGPKTSRPGDVVLTTKGTVGRVAVMPLNGPTYAYSPQLCYLRPAGKHGLDFRYLYYWFKSEQFWTQAGALKAQTDMADFISLQDLMSLKIHLPPVPEQRGIAEVLGALDDKVAANEASVQLADELSRRTLPGSGRGGGEVPCLRLRGSSMAGRTRRAPPGPAASWSGSPN